MYLAACTKGASSESVQKQPYSNIMAKQRAYSLKASFMTSLFHANVKAKTYNRLVDEYKIHSEEIDIQKYVLERINPFLGKTRRELLEHFEINTKNNYKAINSLIMKRIMKVNVDLEKTDEFQKARVKVKTIRLESNGKIREHMSFPAFKFSDLVDTEWEDSELRLLLEESVFMFVVFRKFQKMTMILY
jgi:DNA mismatch repair protein MutH